MKHLKGFRISVLGFFAVSYFVFCGMFDPDPGVFKYDPISKKTIKSDKLEVSFEKLNKQSTAKLTEFDIKNYSDDMWIYDNTWVMSIKNISKEKLRVEPFKDSFLLNQKNDKTENTTELEGNPVVRRTGVVGFLVNSDSIPFVGSTVGGSAGGLVGAGILQAMNSAMFYFKDLEPGQSYTGIVLFKRIDVGSETVTAYFPDLDGSNGFGSDAQKTIFQWKFKATKTKEGIGY